MFCLQCLSSVMFMNCEKSCRRTLKSEKFGFWWSMVILLLSLPKTWPDFSDHVCRSFKRRFASRLVAQPSRVRRSVKSPPLDSTCYDKATTLARVKLGEPWAPAARPSISLILPSSCLVMLLQCHLTITALKYDILLFDETCRAPRWKDLKT